MPFLLSLTLFAAPPIAADEIVVTAPCALTARQLRPALKAFRDGRTARAPASRLFFEADPGARRDGVSVSSLRVRADGRTRPIPADAEGRFAMPDVRGRDWAIVGPCHDGALAISPLVMSPGTDAADRRLGDMRLQCDVGWAIAREAVAEAAGAFTRVVGGCRSSTDTIHAGSVRAIADADVSAGALTLPVRVSEGGYRYSVPIGDIRLPDAARVRFRYR